MNVEHYVLSFLNIYVKKLTIFIWHRLNIVIILRMVFNRHYVYPGSASNEFNLIRINGVKIYTAQILFTESIVFCPATLAWALTGKMISIIVCYCLLLLKINTYVKATCHCFNWLFLLFGVICKNTLFYIRINININQKVILRILSKKMFFNYKHVYYCTKLNYSHDYVRKRVPKHF